MGNVALQPALPRAFSPEVLGRNLDALERTDPRLAARIRLPADGGGVRFDEDGRAWLRLHRSHFPLEVARADQAALAARAGASRSATFVVLGVGLGELVDTLLGRAPELVAWERDPWLLRLALTRRDYAAAILRGRLRFALGTDLLDVPRGGSAAFEHPLLSRIYQNELRVYYDGLDSVPVVLAAGGLFVEDVRRGLERRGERTWTLDVQGQAEEELVHAVRRLRPSCLVTVNYTEGLAEFAARENLRLVCWEIDPATAPPRPVAGDTGHAFVFTYRQASAAQFRRAGFTHVETLPLAADPDFRRPLELTDGERRRFGAPVAFVGSSMVDNAARCRRRFVEDWTLWRGGGEEAAHEASTLLGRVMTAQRRDFSRFVIPALLEAEAPGLREAALEAGREDPAVLAGEIGASEKRLTYCASLADHGLQVWGDAGWSLVERHGVRHRGLAGHHDELTRIYNAAAINLDVGRLYQNDIVPMRVFDVLACGGFALVEHSPSLEELFEVGVEVVSYRTLDELKAKVAWFGEHPGEARAIAERGREAVRERHSIDRRLEHMLARLEGG